MQHIGEIEARIARFDERLLAGLAGAQNALALLQTIPGVDRIGAAMLLVEIGIDIAVFGSPDRLASWMGVCPGNNESAGKRKSGRVRKGNPTVRRLLCEFAHAAGRTQSVFKAKFQALTVLSWTQARHHRHRPQAPAHDLHYAKAWQHYRDSATDYEALSVQRNAPRWIKALTKYGFITPVGA
jgi:transposase